MHLKQQIQSLVNPPHTDWIYQWLVIIKVNLVIKVTPADGNFTQFAEWHKWHQAAKKSTNFHKDLSWTHRGRKPKGSWQNQVPMKNGN